MKEEHIEAQTRKSHYTIHSKIDWNERGILVNKNSNTFKRVISMILVMVMVLGTLPLSAFASAADKNQVVYAGGTKTADVAEHSTMLSVTKTAAQAKDGSEALENLIDITLQVETTAIMKDIPSSAAVVLVMDMSNSMKDTLAGAETNDTDKQRVTMAKNAAYDFVNMYAKDASAFAEPRLLSVVQFGTNASVVSLPGATNGWVNFGGSSGASATAINGIIKSDVKIGFNSDGGATNMSGGLLLADNLLAELQKINAYKDIENLYVILLTDGKPTARLVGGAPTVEGRTYAGIAFDEYYSDGSGSGASRKNVDRDNTHVRKSLDGGNRYVYISEYGPSGRTEWYSNSSSDSIHARESYNSGNYWYYHVDSNGVYSYQSHSSSNDTRNFTVNGKSVQFQKLTATKLCTNYYNNMDDPSITSIDGVYGSAKGSSTNKYTVAAVEYQADKIVNDSSATLYTIAYATASITLDADSKSPKRTLNKFLTDISTECFSATDNDKLAEAFKNIVDKIYMDIQAWTVTDPLGEFMEFVGFTGTSEKKGSDIRSENNDVISWNLTKDLPTNGGSLGDNSKKIFTLTYRMRIDNQATGFKFDEPYPVNTIETVDSANVSGTYLVYDIITNGAKGDSFVQRFPTPEAEAYCGKLEFFKKTTHKEPIVDKGGMDHVGLAGVGFTLFSGSYRMAEAFSKGVPNLGYVELVKIPSGHSYTLEETTKPAGFEKMANRSVDVSWKNVSLNNAVFDNGRYLLKNSLTPVKGSITVKKSWLPVNLSYPDVNIQIEKKIGDGEYTLFDTIKLTSGNWEETFEVDLLDVETNKPISYRAKELAISGWNSTPGTEISQDGKTFTFSFLNVRTSDPINLPVQKDWIKPSSVAVNDLVVKLLANGEDTGKKVDLTSKNGWYNEFTGLDVYDNQGQPILYTFAEVLHVDDADRFDAQASTVENGVHTFHNKIRQSTTQITGYKNWNPAEPANISEVVIELLRNGEKTGDTYTAEKADKWYYEFTALPMYSEDGKTAYTYTVTDNVDGYTTTDGDSENNVTNTQKREFVTFAGEKKWVGDEDVDTAELFRPEAITLHLMQTLNGSSDKVDEITLSGADVDDHNWEFAFPTVGSKFYGSGFPVKSEDNQTYTYSLIEVDADGKETKKLEGKDDAYYAVQISDENGFFTVTNTLNGGETSVAVAKVWKAPYDMIPAQLVYIIEGSNGYSDEYVILKPELEADAKWSHNFTNLPLFEDGAEIIYTVSEEMRDADGVKIESGFDMSGPVDAEGVKIFTNTIKQAETSVQVYKVWEGGETLRGNIEITLYRNGVKCGDSKTLVYDASGVNNMVEFTNLPVYNVDGDGARFQYTVGEAMEKNAGFFAPSQNFDQELGAFVITNTFEPGMTSVSGYKHWIAPTGTELPDSIFVNLYADDAPIAIDRTEVTDDGDGNWRYEFIELAKYDFATGVEIVYSIEEEVPAGWISRVVRTDVGTDIYNISEQEYISLELTKVWIGPKDDHQEVDVTVIQKVNGSETGTTFNYTIPAPEEGEIFGLLVIPATEEDGLPKYDENRVAYTYVIEELLVIENYTTSYDQASLTVKNTVVQEFVNVAGIKEWDGGSKHKVEMELLVNGQSQEPAIKVEVDSETGAFEFTKLPKYALGKDEATGINAGENGFEIAYSVREIGESGAENSKTVNFFTDKGRETFTVTYRFDEERELWMVKNTFQDGKQYRYVVNAHYAYTEKDVDGNVKKDFPKSYDILGTEVPGIKNQPVKIDPADYDVYGGVTYDFVEAKLNEIKVGKVEFELGDCEIVYVVDLYFEQTKQDPPEQLPIIPDPDLYSYRIDRNYTYKYTDLQGNVSITIEPPVPGDEVHTASTSITVNPDSYKANNGKNYSFVGGDVDGDERDFVVNAIVTFDDVEHLYIITLNYERTGQETRESFDRRPTNPVVPTPEPTPIPDPIVPLTNISDPVVPLVQPEIIILEPDVPLDVLPKTGYEDTVTRKGGLFAALSMGLLTLVAAMGLRKEEDEVEA